MLVREHGLDAGDAIIIAAMAAGSLSRALRMYRTNWIKRRDWLINELDSLSAGSLNRLLAFGDQLPKDKDNLPDALEVLKSWLRDLVIAKLHPDRIINHDQASKLQQSSQRMSLTSLLLRFETIQSTQNAIQSRHQYKTGNGIHGVEIIARLMLSSNCGVMLLTIILYMLVMSVILDAR